MFGGSFSPVHKGHMAVARGILTQNLAEEVWMMPCKRNPLKGEVPKLSDFLRLELLLAAVEYYNNTVSTPGVVKVSDMELSLPAPSYSFKTMRKLEKEMPDVEWRLVVGADSYIDFEKWYMWDKLEADYHPIVYPRPGHELESVRMNWDKLENVELVDVSSTLIRNLLQKGILDKTFMPWIEGREVLEEKLLDSFRQSDVEKTKIPNI